MNRKLLPLLFIAMAIQLPAAGAQGYSYTDPAPKGVAVTSIVQLGPMNTTNYDVSITLLETVRGRKALEQLQAKGTAVEAPKAGFEYLLARVRFSLQGRAVSDTSVFELGNSPFQWLAYSSQLKQYESVSVKPPQPELRGPVRSGATVEGWVALAVEQNEHEPMLVFDPSAGGATGRGNILFFKMY